MRTFWEGGVIVAVGLLLGAGWSVASGAPWHGTSDEAGAAGAPVGPHDGVGAVARALQTRPTPGGTILVLPLDGVGATRRTTTGSFNLTEEAELLASDGAAGDEFGTWVALEGDTALAGAPFDRDQGLNSGSAYVFVRTGTTWTQQAKLAAEDGAYAYWFGVSVALSGNIALVGALGANGTAFASGAAYAFVRSGTTWTQEAKLVASDGASGDDFGSSVALSGNTAVIGAGGDDDHGYDSGSTYVFVRTGTVWTQQAKLAASDAAAGSGMGAAVDVDGDTAVAGVWRSSPGAAYVFVRNGTAWTQEAKLVADDVAVGQYFGFGVDVEGDFAIVGASGDAAAGENSGAAYVFARNGTSWTQEAKLVASDGSPWSFFGYAVAFDGDTAAVGARGGTTGSAYVFERGGTGWTEEAKLGPSDGAVGDAFGRSVGLNGGTVLVGASSHDHLGRDSGSAYVYRLTPLTPSRSVALDIDPDTLNLKSRGRWITAYLTTEGAPASDIDPESLRLNGALAPAWWDVQVDGTLMVKFDRAAVESMVAPGESVAMWVTGQWRDGEPFEARDTIRVIDPGR